MFITMGHWCILSPLVSCIHPHWVSLHLLVVATWAMDIHIDPYCCSIRDQYTTFDSSPAWTSPWSQVASRSQHQPSSQNPSFFLLASLHGIRTILLLLLSHSFTIYLFILVGPTIWAHKYLLACQGFEGKNAVISPRVFNE